MKLSVKQLYTSIACNRIPEIIDWNQQGLICFGACNAVVIYDTVCLVHLTSVVNAYKVINTTRNTDALLLNS